MANASGMGLKREEGFLVRFTKREMRDFKRRAHEAELSMNDYARCRILDIPLDILGGRSPRGRPKSTPPPSGPAETPSA